MCLFSTHSSILVLIFSLLAADIDTGLVWLLGLKDHLSSLACTIYELDT